MLPLAVGAVPAGGIHVTVVAEQSYPGATTAIVRLYVESASNFTVEGLDFTLAYPASQLTFVSGENNIAGGNWGSMFSAVGIGGAVEHSMTPSDANEPLLDGLFWTGTFDIASSVKDGDIVTGFVFTATANFGSMFTANYDAYFVFEEINFVSLGNLVQFLGATSQTSVHGDNIVPGAVTALRQFQGTGGFSPGIGAQGIRAARPLIFGPGGTIEPFMMLFETELYVPVEK
jgi:hypothetical protein